MGIGSHLKRCLAASLVAASTGISLLPASGWACTTRADELVIGGIAMPGVKITGFHDGQIIYLMNGKENTRDFSEMRLHLDSVPALKAAEDEVEAKMYDQALNKFHKALAEAGKPWQTVWIEYRIMSILDVQGRFTQACQAWSAIVTISDDSIWADHLPVASPDHPSQQIFNEALMFMHNARSRVKRPAVAESLDAMIKLVADEAARPAPLFGDHTAPPPSSSSSSDHGEVNRNGQSEDNPDQGMQTGDNSGRGGEIRVDPYAPNPIDTLIEKGRIDAARRIIDKLVAAPKKYPLDRLLYQFGEVLAKSGEDNEAAQRFMQCNILFRDGGYAGRALIETARLYAGPLNDLDLANGLLDRAIQSASDRNDSYTLTHALQLKKSLTQQ